MRQSRRGHVEKRIGAFQDVLPQRNTWTSIGAYTLLLKYIFGISLFRLKHPGVIGSDDRAPVVCVAGEIYLLGNKKYANLMEIFVKRSW